jgi:hypothetical protein
MIAVIERTKEDDYDKKRLEEKTKPQRWREWEQREGESQDNFELWSTS